jgi:predicted nucleotidyltransferase
MEMERIQALLRELDQRGVQYILVGAVAMNVLGILRATQDIDLFLPPDKGNLARLKEALRAVWDDPEIEGIREEDLLQEYGVIRYGPPGERLTVDLITHLGEAFRYEDLQAEEIEWRGVKVRVATPETLFRMKKDTLRPQDRADAAQLSEKFGLRDH